MDTLVVGEELSDRLRLPVNDGVTERLRVRRRRPGLLLRIGVDPASVGGVTLSRFPCCCFVLLPVYVASFSSVSVCMCGFLHCSVVVVPLFCELCHF